VWLAVASDVWLAGTGWPDLGDRLAGPHHNANRAAAHYLEAATFTGIVVENSFAPTRRFVYHDVQIVRATRRGRFVVKYASEQRRPGL
jgi:hypothetical protein